MSVANCLVKIKNYVKEAGLDENISKDRLEYFAKRLDSIQGDSLSRAEFAEKAQNLFQEDIARENAKRQAANAQLLLQREQTMASIRENVKDWQSRIDQGLKGAPSREQIPYEAVRAWQQGGGLLPGEGTNLSPSLMRDSYRSRFSNLFRQALNESNIPGLRQMFETGQLDHNALLALSAIDEKRPLTGFSEPELAVAKAMKAWRDSILQSSQAVNPYLEKAQNYLWKQMHDPERIAALGKEKWTSLMMDKAGKNSFPEQDLQGKMRAFGEMYDKITSYKWGSIADDTNSDKMIISGRGQQNIMGRMAESRQIQFNDPKSFAEYNSQAGPATIAQGIDKMTNTASNNLALLNKFGTNPEGMRAGIITRLERTLKGADLENFQKMRPKLDEQWRIINGSQNAPAWTGKAKFAQGAMALQAMTKAGMSVFRSTQDGAMGASLLRSLDGSNMAANTAELVGHYAKAMVSSDFRNERLADLGLAAKAGQQELFRLVGGTDKPGLFSQLASKTGSLNLHNQSVDAWGTAIGTVLTKRMGEFSMTRHENLPDSWKQGLARYGIDENKWNAMRLGTEDIDGKQHLTPDGISQLPDEAAENYLRKTGALKPSQEATPRALDYAREQMSIALSTMINEHAQLTSARPDIRQRSFMWGDTSINEGWGMAKRMFTEFKAASIVQADVYRRGYFSGTQPRGDLAGVGQLAATSAFMFMLGDAAKTLVQGKTLEDMTSLKYLSKVLFSCGVTGISLDGIDNALEQGRSVSDKVGNIAKSMLGAAPEQALEVGTTGFQAASDMIHKGYLSKDTSRSVGKSAVGLIPVPQNLPYTKAAFDYYVGNRIKEFAGPGYLGNLENRTYANGQSYNFAKPTGDHFWSNDR